MEGEALIYETENQNTLLQGDICNNLPRITPESMMINIKSGIEVWNEYINYLDSPTTNFPLTFTANPIPTLGVLLTQSCDIRKDKNREITPLVFAELTTNCGRLKEIQQIDKPLTVARKKINIIRQDTHFHFFPSDPMIGVLKEIHVLDFRNFFLVPYELLENNISRFFVARLKPPARAVLCDKISRFFTRLAFEELIFLSDEEIKSRIRNNDITLEEANEILSVVNRSLTL